LDQLLDGEIVQPDSPKTGRHVGIGASIDPLAEETAAIRGYLGLPPDNHDYYDDNDGE
jgi:hypothetical protein